MISISISKRDMSGSIRADGYSWCDRIMVDDIKIFRFADELARSKAHGIEEAAAYLTEHGFHCRIVEVA